MLLPGWRQAGIYGRRAGPATPPALALARKELWRIAKKIGKRG